MNIGIIVHSQTGNTYSVAVKLKEKLLTARHSVNIERIAPIGGEQKDIKKIRIETIPDLSIYDTLIFGSPVQGAAISSVLAAFLTQTSLLQNKKVACFVTELFPFAWMGGNRAISQMKKICESKGAEVCGTGIVNWMGSRREKKIVDVVEKLSKLF